MIEQFEVNWDEAPDDISAHSERQAAWLRIFNFFGHVKTPAGASTSNDAAAHPQTQRANCHDHEAKIAARILIRSKSEGSAYPCDQYYQPVQPTQKGNEPDDGENEGDESEQECDNISHDAVVRA
jgi:hypothetical protein